MADFSQNVRALSAAAWRLRRAAAQPCDIPFALALFTDDRRQGNIEAMLSNLPKASRALPPIAIVFRHDGLAAKQRYLLAKRILEVTHRRGHFFLMARGYIAGANGQHAPHTFNLSPRSSFISTPAHSIAEGVEGQRKGAHLSFISPIFPTASHPGARPLGVARAGAIAHSLRQPTFALGGVNLETAKRLHGTPFQGIGAISAFST
ncbi:MAG: thiamine phosphate synthase [Pseudomonadota bacterium]